jgi:hypothetical protein
MTMSTPLPDARATPVPQGLIETIQAGFNTVNHNLWLLLLPLALDLSLWVGPQLTPGGLAEAWLRQMAAPPGSSQEVVQTVEENRRAALESIRQGGGLAQYNVLSLLAVPVLGLGVPSFRALEGAPGLGPTLSLGSASALGATAVASLTVGVSLAALFYGLLGQAVREGQVALQSFARDFRAVFVSAWGVFGLFMVVLLGVGLPLIGVLVLTGSVSSIAANVLGSIALGMFIWALVYLFFTTDAVYVSCVAPFAAVQRSVVLVRTNFWPTLGFIGLLTIISLGLPIIWSELAHSLQAPGIALGILGHDYITSGVAAASMTYYKVRVARLEGAVQSA